MMRKILILLAGALTLQGWTQAPWPYSKEQTYGKSEREILAMGRDAWFDFATEQPGGGSTAGMSEAEHFFGTALQRRNDALFAPFPAAKRKKIETLRKSLTDYGNACTALSATFSGGGTLWNTVYAGVLGDVEELVGMLAGLPPPQAPPRTRAEIDRRLATIASVLRTHRKDVDLYRESGFGADYGLRQVAEAKRAFSAAYAIVRTLPTSQSNAFLDACLQRANRIEFNIDEPYQTSAILSPRKAASCSM